MIPIITNIGNPTHNAICSANNPTISKTSNRKKSVANIHPTIITRSAITTIVIKKENTPLIMFVV